jgi:hypothetical protein
MEEVPERGLWYPSMLLYRISEVVVTRRCKGLTHNHYTFDFKTGPFPAAKMAQ